MSQSGGFKMSLAQPVHNGATNLMKLHLNSYIPKILEPVYYTEC